MLKILLDNLVLLIVCWIALVLAFVEGGVVVTYISNAWAFPLYAVLFFANGAGLMWLWHRFGPTRSRKQDRNDDN